MKIVAVSLVLFSALASAQAPPDPVVPPTPATLSTPGPLFTTPDSALHSPVTFIAYGDNRFTDPSDTTDTNPTARRDLVARIVEERPEALLVSGDIPYRGGIVDDYTVFRRETEPWRTAGLRVYPALGNHEYSKCKPAACLENWWNAFPEIPQLRNRRWYSAQLGSSLYFIALDSAASLLPGAEQRKWLEQQIADAPKTVRFIVLNLHHPPVADVQTTMHVDHNPRPNEISLADYLQKIAPSTHARLIVVAGHIHNYERFEQGGVTYFVSGGGGATPYEVDRTPKDLYQDKNFPNYHYIRFTLQGNDLKGEMVRLQTPTGTTPVWQTKDTFTIKGK